MNLPDLVRQSEKLLKEHSQVILTGLGVGGTVGTAYLAHQAGYLAGEYGAKNNPFKERAKRLWKNYIPVTVSGTATIGCIIFASRVGSRKAAAAAAAYSVSEKAFSEYREKVTEKLGVNKERAARDEIAQDRVNKNPPPTQNEGVIISGPSNVLCCEAYTGRYFYSDMETLRRAENEVNATMMRHMRANLSEFYYHVGLHNTSTSDRSGWNVDKLLKLEFSTVMSPDGRPCISFDYNYVEPF